MDATAEAKAERLAAEEGLGLHRAPGTISGYRCVKDRSRELPNSDRPFQVAIREANTTVDLGYYPTAHEAALVYARHVGPGKAPGTARLATRHIGRGFEQPAPIVPCRVVAMHAMEGQASNDDDGESDSLPVTVGSELVTAPHFEPSGPVSHDGASSCAATSPSAPDLPTAAAVAQASGKRIRRTMLDEYELDFPLAQRVRKHALSFEVPPGAVRAQVAVTFHFV